MDYMPYLSGLGLNSHVLIFAVVISGCLPPRCSLFLPFCGCR